MSSHTILAPVGCGGTVKGKGIPYSTVEHRVLELIPVLGSLPAGDMSQIPDGRLLPISLPGEHRHDGCKQFA